MKRLWMDATLLSCAYVFILVFSSVAQANPHSCNQRVYDSLYRTIIAQTVLQITPKDFEERNIAIRTLRELCRGQRSTYETASKDIPLQAE